MFESHPPRRDPRVLLLDLRTTPIPYAALDAWELRTLGELPRHGPSGALLRLLLQVRPSHVVLAPSGAPRVSGLGVGLATAARRGLPVLTICPPDLASLEASAPALATLPRAYPELRHLASYPCQTPQLRALRLALAVLLHHPLPPRRYVSRFSVRPSSSLGR